jgi:uncharacterized protein
MQTNRLTMPPPVDTLLEAILSRIAAAPGEVSDVAHQVDHIRHVVHNCRQIFPEVSCNQRVTLLAACLHDVAPRLEGIRFGDAAFRSAEAARDLLWGFECSEEEIAAVQECIRTASWEFHLRGGHPASVEAYVLRDADFLEAIGAHGTARVFGFAGSRGLPLSWNGLNPDKPRRLQPLADRPDPTPFYHFESKLLWIRDLLYSNTAKAEAERRHAFLADFLQQYRRENEWVPGGP